MIENAWVIQRNDDYETYLVGGRFTDILARADIFETEGMAWAQIEWWGVTNCNPVKVEIKVVEE